jgi:aryl-alcohol dehydrogenase-like predicted oxidoreductase
MTFERRTLGRTDLVVSPFGIGGGYGVDGNSVEWAFEHGINYFFWAPWVPTYRPMERGLRSLLPRYRDEIVIATAAYFWFFPGSIERALKKHLRRLNIDHIDLFLLGWVLRESQQRTVDELVRIKEKGLARYIGFSAHKRSMILRMAQRWPVFDVLMIRYNAANRGAEYNIFSHLEEKNRQGIVVFNALKHGALLKRPKEWPEDRPIPTSRQCYRFVLSHPSVDLCLAGPRRIAHVKELVKVVKEGPLSPDEISFMREFGDVCHGDL